MSDELQAWLSAYEAGTLSEEERKQLFARALEDQALFDALMEAETMRAAMEGPLAKRALLQALEEVEMADAEEAVPLAAGAVRAARAASPVVMPMPMAKKAERRGGWWWMVGVAAVLVVSVGTYSYLRRPAEVMVAVAPKPEAPVAALPEPAVVDSEKPRREAPKKVKREETPTFAEPPAAPAPAVPAPAVAAPSANEVAEVAKSAELKDAAAPEGRARMSVGGARGNMASSSMVRVVGGRVEVAAEALGQLYVFVEGPNGWTRVAGLAPQVLLVGGARSFALPAGLRGNLVVLVAPQRDAELDGLAEPYAGTLPVRNWTRVRLP